MDFSAGLKFLQALTRNNNRDWFERNRPKYLVIKDSFDEFLEGLLHDMTKFDEGLAGVNPRKLAFRIYRDVRFSKDKRPYKSHLSAGISPGGKLLEEAGYYLHIQPGNNSKLAGGLYSPGPENLAKIRQEIDYNADAFLKILSDKKFKRTFSALVDFDKLKTAPKGYPADHPQIDLLRNRSFVVSHTFTDKEVIDKKFIKKVLDTAKTLKPMNDFLNGAIS